MIAPIVEASWVAAHRGDVVLVDVRWQPRGDARAAFRDGHIAGAVALDLDEHLADPAGPVVGRHPLPSPERFAAVMSEHGIGDDDTVVGYDDAGGAYAARLVWMLRATGHEAALLDGGLAAWPGPVEEGEPRPRAPATFTPRPWPLERLADAELVDVLRRDPQALVLDARDRRRFRGEHEPIDRRAGHIPGARNAPFADNLDEDGRFLPPEELRQRFRDLGVEDVREVVVHCGSGVTACHELLAIEHAGLGPGRLYVGSWSGWSSDDDRPVATGD